VQRESASLRGLADSNRSGTFGTLIHLPLRVLPLDMESSLAGWSRGPSLTADFDAGYGTPTIVSFSIVAAGMVYAVSYSVASQPLFSDHVL
jgi:hypothetical protein